MSWIDGLASPEDLRRRKALIDQEAVARRLEQARLWAEAAQQVALIPQALRVVQAKPGVGACRRWSAGRSDVFFSCEDPIRGWKLGELQAPEKGAVFVDTDWRFKFIRLASRNALHKHNFERGQVRQTVWEAVGSPREATPMEATKALIGPDMDAFWKDPGLGLMVRRSDGDGCYNSSPLGEYLQKWVENNRGRRSIADINHCLDAT